MRAEWLAQHPPFQGDMITPDQYIAGGPTLLQVARDGVRRVLRAPNRRELLTIAPLAAHTLAEACDALEAQPQSGRFLALFAFARRASAEICTCTPLQLERRRQRLIAVEAWCVTCHARAALGLANTTARGLPSGT